MQGVNTRGFSLFCRFSVIYKLVTKAPLFSFLAGVSHLDSFLSKAFCFLRPVGPWLSRTSLSLFGGFSTFSYLFELFLSVRQVPGLCLAPFSASSLSAAYLVLFILWFYLFSPPWLAFLYLWPLISSPPVPISMPFDHTSSPAAGACWRHRGGTMLEGWRWPVALEGTPT